MGATSLTELSTLQDKLSSSPVYRRVHVADLLVVCVSLFVLLSFFSLGHCIFSSSFFSWPLYFQSFLFLLDIVFSALPFSFGHCNFSPSFFSWSLYFQSFLFIRSSRDGPHYVIGNGGRAGVHTGFRTITLVLYNESLPNLATWFPGRRGRTLFILGSLGQRSRSPLL
jgi:hypothetical protein